VPGKEGRVDKEFHKIKLKTQKKKNGLLQGGFGTRGLAYS
jgi:hypothetical protein